MKRKVARQEKIEKEANNASDVDSENQSDDLEIEQNSDKKKKADKRKSGKKSAKDEANSEYEEDVQLENSKKKSGRKVGKSAKKKDESDEDEYGDEENDADDAEVEENGEAEVHETKKKRGGKVGESKKKKGDKRKSSKKSKKEEVSDAAEDSDQSEPEQKKTKSEKKKGKKVKDAEEEENEDEDEEEYEVQDIIDERTSRGVHQYLIRWKGYGSDGDTWEAESTLNCPDIISKFQELKGGEKNGTKAKKGKSKKDKKDKKLPDVDWSSDDEFEVDRILEVHFKRNGKREFLVSWKGYPSTQDSWEPEENLDCSELINKFMEKVAAAKVVDSKDLRIKRVQTERFTLQMAGSSRRLSRRLGVKQRVQYHDAE